MILQLLYKIEMEYGTTAHNRIVCRSLTAGINGDFPRYMLVLF
ncbi:MAG: hypothetical protein Pg6C_12710 [Treponemataceae bacterium]|jgi:hypothetical protein|nr:MAG: hypothetical protein Pg6C_12710 [Treponemataceae bacterium]